MIDQEIRKDGQGKIDNIAIVTFSIQVSAEKALTGINKTNKYIAKKYEYQTSSEALLIQETKKDKQRKTKNRTSKTKATHSRMLRLWVK